MKPATADLKPTLLSFAKDFYLQNEKCGIIVLNHKENAMGKNLNLSMFKVYDIRTKAQNLTPEIKEWLYNAIALYYKNSVKAKSIIICRDARLSAPDLAEGLAQMFLLAGIDVYLNPLPISTCQFYFSCMQHPEASGIMVTASHNPGEYIGLKLLATNLEPIAFGSGPDGGIKKIKELYNQDAKISGNVKGRITIINYLDSFIDYSMRLAGVKEGSLAGLRIMLEFLNGSAGTEIALAFQKAGAEIDARNVVPNGFFPMGDPNPIIESSIAPARLAMKNGDYDLGFCLDGDGDRLDLMNSNGEQIVPGLNMAIILPKIFEIYKNTKTNVYADVKAIPLALCEMAKTGANVHIIRNGHSFIKAKLRENHESGYCAAEEETAHYYMNFPFDQDNPSKGYATAESSLFFALLTARCYKENPSLYKKAYRTQNSFFRYREWPLHCEACPEKMPELMERVEYRMKELGATVIRHMDDGSDLDATLFRFNLPKTFNQDSSLNGIVWAQVAQRISRSEEAMCRWEIVSNDKDMCEKLNKEVRAITDICVRDFGAKY